MPTTLDEFGGVEVAPESEAPQSDEFGGVLVGSDSVRPVDTPEQPPFEQPLSITGQGPIYRSQIGASAKETEPSIYEEPTFYDKAMEVVNKPILKVPGAARIKEAMFVPFQVASDIAEGNEKTPIADKVVGFTTSDKALDIGAGATSGTLELVNFFSSPLGIATMGMGTLPAAAQKAVSLAFTAQMASSLPDIAKEMTAELRKPEDERDYQKLAALTVNAIGTTGFTVAGARHGLGETKRAQEREAFLGSPDWSQTVPPPVRALAGTFGADTGVPPAETSMVRTSPDVFGGKPFIPRGYQLQPAPIPSEIPATERTAPDASQIPSAASTPEREVRPPVGEEAPHGQPGQAAITPPPEAPAQAATAPSPVNVTTQEIRKRLTSLTEEEAIRLVKMSPEEANSLFADAAKKRNDLIAEGRPVSDPEYQHANDWASGVDWKAQQAGRKSLAASEAQGINRPGTVDAVAALRSKYSDQQIREAFVQYEKSVHGIDVGQVNEAVRGTQFALFSKLVAQEDPRAIAAFEVSKPKVLASDLVPMVEVEPGKVLEAKPDQITHADILKDAGIDPKTIPHEDPRREFINPATGQQYSRTEAEEATGIKGTAEAGGLDSTDLPRAKAQEPPPATQQSRETVELTTVQLPEHSQGAIQAANRTDYPGIANSNWKLETVPLESLKSGNEMLWGTGKFSPRKSVSKGPVVISSKGEVIDGNNRLYKAINHGDKTIEIYREVPKHSTPPASQHPEVKAEEGKAPWQMSQSEWNAATRFYRSGKTKNAQTPTGERVILKQESTAKNHAEVSSDFYKMLRGQAVAKAIKEGLPVPPEVLADYPELVKSATPPPAEATTGETLDKHDTTTETAPDATATRQPVENTPGLDVREPTRTGTPTPPAGDVGKSPGPEVPASPESGGQSEAQGTERAPGVRGGTERSPGTSGRTGDERQPADTTPVSGAAPNPPEPPRSPSDLNHVLPRDADWIPKGDKAKVRANIDAIKLLRKLETENRNATPEEKAKLAQYVGWGGLKPIFNEGKAAYRQRSYDNLYGEQKAEFDRWQKGWGKLYDEVKSILTPEEWDRAARSILNAHYTSRRVITAMWDAVQRMGFKGGVALEPAEGIGHFIGLQPEPSRANTKWAAVELDSISGRIASKLYPEANHQLTGFQTARLPNNSVDLVISNFPFAKEGPADPRYPDLSLHNYFMARSLDVVKPGGIVAAITSNSTMDSAASRAARQYIAERADLVGAIRLPNTAFKENAGTEVTTDILFFRKRDNTAFPGQPFTRTVESETYKHEPIGLNEYFQSHPDMMLGRMSLEGTMYRDQQPALLPRPGEVLEEELAKAIEKLPLDAFSATQTGGAAPEAGDALSSKIGGMVLRDGKPVIAQSDGTFESPDWAGQAAKVTQAKSYIGIRDSTKGIIEKMLSTGSSDVEIEQARSELNHLYDDYTRKFGAVNERKSSYLEDDVDFPLVLALEDANTKLVESKTARGTPITRRVTEWTKSKIFSERTIFPREAPQHVDTHSDGYQVSMNFRGKVDPDYIAKLTGRTVEEIKDSLQKDGLAYENPKTGQWEPAWTYLSGQVRDKLAEAKRFAGDNPRYQGNIDALEKVQPEPIAFENISFKLGSTFIKPEVVQRFLREKLGLAGAKVSYTEQTGNWHVDSGYEGVHEALNKTQYGIHDIDGSEMVRLALNLKTPLVTKLEPRVSAEGKSYDAEVKDAKATLEAQEKQSQVRRAFSEWVKQDPKSAKAIEENYNLTANGSRVPTFEPPTWTHYPGASTDIALRDHQKRVVTRMLQNSTMLAHAVGTGKTYAMVTAAMEARRLGLAKKPLIVVQNATLEQFARSFKRLYPTAKILAPSSKQRDSVNRQRTMSRIATGDWDAVIVPQSFVNMMPDDPARMQKYLGDQLAEMKAAQIAAAAEGGKKSPKAADLQRAVEKLEKQITNLADRAQDNVLNFDQTGVDMLFVDEAHEYKKLQFFTNMDNIKGLDTGFSKIGLSMLMKVRSVQERNQGRNVIFATGTPVSNTIAEAWNMMRYLRPDILKHYGMENFDSFAANFGDTVTQLEMTAGGSWKSVTRFAKYTNGPELISAWREVADVVTPEEVNLPGLPALRTGKVQPVTIKQTPLVTDYVAQLRAELEAFDAMTGKQKRDNSHIPLVVFGRARKATLDMRLIDSNLHDEPGSKLNVICDEVARIYKETSSVKGAQMVFADLFQNADGKFNLYDAIKEKLIQRGIKPDQILIMTDELKDAKRDSAFQKFNDGELRIAIGSTKRMGTGINAQEHIIALHHMDAPFRPMDIEQRNGRALRQGNQNPIIDIKSYGVENTLDAALFQRLSTKQKFINQILRGDVKGRQFEDAANEVSMSFDEQMAAFSGDPLALEKVTLENQVRNLEALRSGHFQQVRDARSNLDELIGKSIPYTESDLVRVKAKSAEMKPVLDSLDTLPVKFGERVFSTKKDAAEFLNERFSSLILQGKDAILKPDEKGVMQSWRVYPVENGFTIGGRKIDLQVRAEAKASPDAKGVVTDATIHWASDEGNGDCRTGNGFYSSFASNLEYTIEKPPVRVADDLASKKRQVLQLQSFVTQPFERESELQEVQKRYGEVLNKIVGQSTTKTARKEVTPLGLEVERSKPTEAKRIQIRRLLDQIEASKEERELPDGYKATLVDSLRARLGEIEIEMVGKARESQPKAPVPGEGELTPDQAKVIGSVSKPDIVSKLESLKIKPGPEGVASFPDPEIFKQIGRDVWNTAIDLAIQGVKAGRAIAAVVDEAVAYIRTKVQNIDETRVREVLHGRIRAAITQHETTSNHQVAGVPKIGPEYIQESVDAIRNQVRQFEFHGNGAQISPETDREWWQRANEFANPDTRSSVADRIKRNSEAGLRAEGKNQMTAQMAPGLYRNELWDYAVRKMMLGEPSMWNCMLMHNQEFHTASLEDVFAGTDTGAGRILRAAQERSLPGLWRTGLAYAKGMMAAAGRAFGVGPELIEQIQHEIDNVRSRMTSGDLKDFDDIILHGKKEGGKSIQDILDRYGPDRKEAEEITKRNVPKEILPSQRGKVFETVHRYLRDSGYAADSEARFKSDLKEDLMTALGADLPRFHEYDRLAENIANDAWLRRTEDLDKKTHRFMDAEYRKLDAQAETTADSEIRKLNDLRLPSGVPNKVRDILRDFLKSSRPTDNENEFRSALQSVLVEAGVPESRAGILARDIYDKRVMDKSHARVVAIERASKSSRAGSLVEDLLNTPYLAQNDPKWRMDTAIRHFMDAGLSKHDAEVASKIFDREFTDLLAKTAAKQAVLLLKNARPNSLRDLTAAIRLGLTDPSRQWPANIAEREGFKPLTPEQHRAIAELEQKASNPDLSFSESVALREQMFGIMRHVGDPKGKTRRLIAESFATTFLTGPGTIGIHEFQPDVNIIASWLMNIPFHPADFVVTTKALGHGIAAKWNNYKFSWQNDAYIFNKDKVGWINNELKRVSEESRVDWQKGSYFKAAVKAIYGSQQYLIRLLQTSNQASMVMQRDWRMALYGSRAMREAGFNTGEIGMMVEAGHEAKKHAYQKALDEGKSPALAGVIGDEAWAQALHDFFANNLGDPKATEIDEAALNDAYALIGRMTPGVKEEEEGMLSRYGAHQLLKLVTEANRQGAEARIGSILAFGYATVPLRLTRYYAGWGPYGLIRQGFDRWKQMPNRETRWQQTYRTSLQKQQRLQEALVGTGLMLGFFGWQFSHRTSDDDALDHPFALYATGHGPNNPVLQDAWKRRGFEPYTINVVAFGKVVAKIPTTRIGEAFSWAAGLPAAWDDFGWKQKEHAEAFPDKPLPLSTFFTVGLGTMYHLAGAQGIFQNLGHLIGSGGSDPGVSLQRSLINMAGSTAAGLAIPWKSAANWLSDTLLGKPDRSSIQANLIANVPVLGVMVNGKAINRFGDALGDRTWSGTILHSGLPFVLRVSDTPENREMYQMLIEKGAAPSILKRTEFERRYGPQDQSVWTKYSKLSGDTLKGMVVDNLAQLQALPPQAVREFMVSAAESANAQAAMTMNLEPVPSARGGMAHSGGGGGGFGASPALPALPTASSMGLPRSPIGGGGAGLDGGGASSSTRVASSGASSAGMAGSASSVGSGRIGRSAGRFTRPRRSAPATRSPRLVSGRLRARSGRLHRIKLARGKKAHRISFKG